LKELARGVINQFPKKEDNEKARPDDQKATLGESAKNPALNNVNNGGLCKCS